MTGPGAESLAEILGHKANKRRELRRMAMTWPDREEMEVSV